MRSIPGISYYMLGVKSGLRKEARELATRTGSGDQTDPLEVQVEDDNPKALAVVLYLIDQRLERAPKEVNLEQLYELAALCDN